MQKLETPKDFAPPLEITSTGPSILGGCPTIIPFLQLMFTQYLLSAKNGNCSY